MYDVVKGYELAKEFYGQYGIEVDKAIEICIKTPALYPLLAGRGR